jgi:hypothetical protein
MTDYLDELERDFGYMLTHTSGYVCPGWEQLIRDMLTEIAHNSDRISAPEFTQIKEKFGTLRVYGYNISDDEQEILDKYERLSAVTCEVCGKAGTMREKNRWQYVACDEHAKED